MINYYTLSLIVTFMLVSRGLELSGIFDHIVVELLTRVRRPLLLLILLIMVAGLSSSLIMNDAALFIYVPLASIFIRSLKLNKDAALTLLVLSINIGSALTPIGNPQNIIIWQIYGVSFHDFVYHLVPFIFVSLSIIVVLVYLLFRRDLNVSYKVYKPPKIYLSRKLLYTSVGLLVVDIVMAQIGYSVIGFIITILIYLIVDRNILLGIDYVLPAVFAFMFIDFTELSRLLHGVLIMYWDKTYTTLLIAALLSQIMSNVPATIILVNHINNWIALAIGVNIGGTGIITGSLANIIALRLGKISIRKFLKISIPYFILVLVIFYVLAYVGVYP